MPSIADVKAYLIKQGIEVREFEELTPTSETAAKAVGCSVAEIAKSILFVVGDQPVVAVTCGDRRIKGSRLKQAAGLTGKVRLPGQDEVLRYTGYAPGGVCPFLLPPSVKIVIDSAMRRFPRVYAAAGNDRSAVPITVEQLLSLTGGIEAAVSDAADHTG
ncbi:MAG: YbaK/EbsC family protein [Desulfosoma sp.]